ncbi:MAG: folate-binding protein YgfZ [Rhodomicrobium sp.]|nr:folate-binding protein YgfZ [Rhodomicrobium sp.]
MQAALLPDRSVIEAAGEDRISFLQGLITNDVEGLAKGAACFAGLLSPQGKILFDFFAVNTGETLLLDCPSAISADFLKRLGFYKIRAKATFNDVSSQWRAVAAWGDGAAEFLSANASIAYQDPRLPALGYRALLNAAGNLNLSASAQDYEAMRVAVSVPEGGKDYIYGDAFPHEACFDQLQGVNFKKGCYVGQEVVSRMQHRGTARTRVLAVAAEQPLPQGGADILADGFAVGRLGSVAGSRGVALARIDRVKEALAKGQPLTAGGIPVVLSVPSWASYSLEAEAAGAAN